MSTGQSYQQLRQAPAHDDSAYGTHELGGAPGGKGGYTSQQDYGGYGSQSAGSGQAGGYTIKEAEHLQPGRRPSGGQAGYTSGGDHGSHGLQAYGGGPAVHDLGAGVGGMNRQTTPQDYQDHRRESGYTPKTKGGMQMKDESMSLVLFLTSICIFLSSFLCSFNLVASFSVIDWLNMIYIGLFGLIMALLDIPFRLNGINVAKQAIMKYVNFLTRFTGKGLIYTFLGCALMSTIMSNVQGSLLEVLIMVMAGFVIFIGLATFTIGIYKTLMLSRAKRALGGGSLDRRYHEFAKSHPNGGLTKDEFNKLCEQVTGKSWDDLELKLIFNAIGTVPAWRKEGSALLTMNELKSWSESGITML